MSTITELAVPLPGNSPFKGAPLAEALAGLHEQTEAAPAASNSRKLIFLLVGGAAALVVGLVAMAALASRGGKDNTNILPAEVTRGDVVVTVTGKGVLESANNVSIKCQVEGGSKILWIVEDGKRVEEGEELVRLDDSSLKTQVQTQEINVEKAGAIKKQAEEDFKVAVKAVEEYENGTFIKDQQTAETQVTIAQENLSSAKNSLEHSQRMHRKGYISELQLDADVFAVKRATLELASAETAIKVLKEFTKIKMLTQLRSARDAAESKMKSEQKAYELEKTKLSDMVTQRNKCVIRAPKAGIVVYANDNTNRRGGQTAVRIEEGAAVNAQQDILRMPDLSQMQAKVMVSETKIEQVGVGASATVRLFHGREYHGRVTSIANQSDAKSWASADIKEYAVLVELEDLKETLKPGMTAEGEILIAQTENSLRIPVTAVVHLDGGSVAWVKQLSGLEKRPLKVGLANDKVIEIRDGLVEGENVVLNPRAVVPEAREEEAREASTPKRFAPGGRKALGPNGAVGELPGKKSGKTRQGGGGDPMATMDANKDGKITRDEAKGNLLANFDRWDQNKDGALDASEVATMQETLKKERQAKQSGGGAVGGGAGAGAP